MNALINKSDLSEFPALKRMSSRLRNNQREPDLAENGDVRRSKRVRERPRYFIEDQDEVDDRSEQDSDFEANSGSGEDSEKEKKKKNAQKGPNVRKKAKYHDNSDSSFKASSSQDSSSGINCFFCFALFYPRVLVKFIGTIKTFGEIW